MVLCLLLVRDQVGERGWVGKAGKDGLDEHGLIGTEVVAQRIGVALTGEDEIEHVREAHGLGVLRPPRRQECGECLVCMLFVAMTGGNNPGNQLAASLEVVRSAAETVARLEGLEPPTL